MIEAPANRGSAMDRSYCYDSEGYETEELAVFFTRNAHHYPLFKKRAYALRRIILDNLKTKEYRTVWQSKLPGL